MSAGEGSSETLAGTKHDGAQVAGAHNREQLNATERMLQKKGAASAEEARRGKQDHQVRTGFVLRGSHTLHILQSEPIKPGMYRQIIETPGLLVERM